MRYHRRRGLTLVELLIALSLLGVFALLVFRLLGANFRLSSATQTASGNSARFDDATGQLRADVSDSSSMEMTTANVLQIQRPGKPVVEWQCNRNVLSRKMTNEHRQWDVGSAVKLKLDGAVVLLGANSAEPIAMASIHPRQRSEAMMR
jgi:prepilin-type N-terminal cleavage/methylation domain-containing protein